MAAVRSTSLLGTSGMMMGSTSGSRSRRGSKKGSGRRARSREIGSRSSRSETVELSEIVLQSRPESGSLHSMA